MLDSQRKESKAIFGGGFFVSHTMGQRLDEARRQADEARSVTWELSPRELEIIDRLEKAETAPPQGALYDDLGYERYQYIFKNAEWLTTTGKGYEDITEYLNKSEKGTRVEVSIKFSSGGHELVAMNDNGIVRFIDVQNHLEIKDFEKYFELVIDGHTRFARIDNLEPTELIKECLEVAL